MDFWSDSSLAMPPASRLALFCCWLNVPSTIGASMPTRPLVAVWLAPENFEMAPTREPSDEVPSSEPSMLEPCSAMVFCCGLPSTLLKRPSSPVSCLPSTSNSERAPSAFVALVASEAKITGTAALTILSVIPWPRPRPEASLPMSAGARYCIAMETRFMRGPPPRKDGRSPDCDDVQCRCKAWRLIITGSTIFYRFPIAFGRDRSALRQSLFIGLAHVKRLRPLTPPQRARMPVHGLGFYCSLRQNGEAGADGLALDILP